MGAVKLYTWIGLLSGGNVVETKRTVRELLDRLPDDCTLDDVLYHLYVLQSVARGRADVENGRILTHEEVAEQLRKKWLLGNVG